jgi:magnesium-transporting ATPase (P-type)
VAAAKRVRYDSIKRCKRPLRGFSYRIGCTFMMSHIWAFLIYWLVIFVACFIVVEVGQDQLYDEVTPRAGLKVGSGSFLIAALLTALRYFEVPASFESMFTTNIAWTLLQGIVWFGVFTLILQFHPWHALGLGIATMLLVSGLATMGVESILAPSPRTAAGRAFAPTPAVRQSLTPSGAPAQTKAAEKAK